MDILRAAIDHLLLINDKNSRYERGDPEEVAREDINDMSNCDLLELLTSVVRSRSQQ